MKICLDAGHAGKYNRSPANSAYYESEGMWKLTNYLKAELEQYENCQVILTKKSLEDDPTLDKRGKTAKGCNLFLSLHSNAVGNVVDNSVDYPVALCYSDDTTTKIDDISRDLGLKLAKTVQSVMGTKQAGKVALKKADWDRDYNGKLDDEWYGVLQAAKKVGVVGIILEHSFHTNLKSTNWLLNDGNLKKLAKAEAEVISQYYNLKKPANQAETKSKKLYRVQVGAYSVKKNADAMVAKLKADGYPVYVYEEEIK